MGVLDDAIREHLELKRQHGADESELRRKEDEALGPPRRDAAELPAGEEQPPADVSPAAEDEVVDGDVVAADDDPFAGDEPFAEAPREPAEVFDDAQPAGDEPALYEEGPLETPVPAATEERPAYEDDPLPPGEETAFLESEPDEHRAFEEPPSDPSSAESDEDVLEETPDFLQETPEHDRLWFEQKPPRDFDFDDK